MEPFPKEGEVKKLEHRVDQISNDRTDNKWCQHTEDHLDSIPDNGKLENDLYQERTDQKAYHCIDRDRKIFGIAMKATAGVTSGKFHFIYKDPKTDSANLKKSHKGIVWVQRDSEGKLFQTDEHNELLPDTQSELKTVFYNGVLYNKQTFAEIRERIAKGV